MHRTNNTRRFRIERLVAVVAAAGFLWACSDDTSSSDSAGSAVGGSSSAGAASGGSGGTQTSGNASSGSGDGGFSPTTTGGGGGGGRGNCSGTLQATVRDFMVSHPDFETFTGAGATTGLVATTLGADGKPVFQQAGGQITDATTFADWYNDINGVNQSFSVPLQLTETAPGVYSYVNNSFFPLDGQGWGNEGNPHNFHFTTELHTSFEYVGGEVFTFNGDDDLWVFINNELAIDLGGLHASVEGSVVLDDVAAQLGITVGNVYNMDLFHAERHTTASNFRVDTTISCFVPPPT